MRHRFLSLCGLLLSCLAGGCDKCGDPIKFNAPSLPNACYESPVQQ